MWREHARQGREFVALQEEVAQVTWRTEAQLCVGLHSAAWDTSCDSVADSEKRVAFQGDVFLRGYFLRRLRGADMRKALHALLLRMPKSVKNLEVEVEK